MSETVFRFLLSELVKARVVCRGKDANGRECGAVLEVPVDKLADLFRQACICPYCKTPFCAYLQSGQTVNPFPPLADAIAQLNAVQDRVAIEFTLPVKNQPAGP
jgi:hypothetical protein